MPDTPFSQRCLGNTGSTPHVAIDPTIQYGQPCIGGTRITTETLAGRVWAGDTVDDTAFDFGLSREAVLVACWWESRYAPYDGWFDWGLGARPLMNRGDWGLIADPPARR